MPDAVYDVVHEPEAELAFAWYPKEVCTSILDWESLQIAVVTSTVHEVRDPVWPGGCFLEEFFESQLSRAVCRHGSLTESEAE